MLRLECKAQNYAWGRLVGSDSEVRLHLEGTPCLKHLSIQSGRSQVAICLLCRRLQHSLQRQVVQ